MERMVLQAEKSVTEEILLCAWHVADTQTSVTNVFLESFAQKILHIR